MNVASQILLLFKTRNLFFKKSGPCFDNGSRNHWDIFKLEYVDGGLIGGSSLDANNFAKIYKNLC